MRRTMSGRESPTHHIRTADLYVAFAIFLVSFFLLVFRAAPGVLPGDSGEFQFVPYIWGVAHPTGYPLYTILGGLWSHLLPFGNVARRMNLFSSLWGAAALGEIYLATASLGEKEPAWSTAGGLAAAYVLLFSPIFQRESLVAEVYSMHAAILAALLLVSLAWLERGDERYAFWSMLLLGIGLAHHRTVLLFLPGLVAGVLASFGRNRAGFFKRTWPRLLAALLLPLVLYVYIPIRAPHLSYLKLDLGKAGSWNLYEPSLKGFLEFVSGSRFSGNLLVPSEAVARLPEAWSILISQAGIVGLALAGLGALAMLVRRRWAMAGIVLVSLASFLGFNLLYGIGDIRDFYGPPMVFMALLAGYGLRWVAAAPREKKIGVLAASMAAIALLALHQPSLLDYHDSHQTELKWEKLLSLRLPDDSILVTNDRDEMVPLYYYQLVEHRRPGWQPLYPLIVPTKEWNNVAKVFRHALDSGRPVYTIKKMEQMQVAFEMQDGPDGTEKVLPMRLPDDMIRLDANFGGRLRLLGVKVESSSGRMKVEAYWKVTGGMEPKAVAYIHLLDVNGKKVSKGRDYIPGYPYYPPEQWESGETVRVSQIISFRTETDCGFLLMGWYTKSHQLGKPIKVKLNGGVLCRKY